MMRARRLLCGLLLALGSLIAVVLLRRRVTRRHERVDLYFEDGSMFSLAERSPGADRLLPLARELLRDARS